LPQHMLVKGVPPREARLATVAPIADKAWHQAQGKFIRNIMLAAMLQPRLFRLPARRNITGALWSGSSGFRWRRSLRPGRCGFAFAARHRVLALLDLVDRIPAGVGPLAVWLQQDQPQLLQAVLDALDVDEGP